MFQQGTKSIRPFIGAKDFNVSRQFYRELGFEETILSAGFSVFKVRELAFYLQDAYVKDWVDNTMLFLEVESVNDYWTAIQALELDKKYAGVRLLPPRTEVWGTEFFLHDPSGILWHIGTFS